MAFLGTIQAKIIAVGALVVLIGGAFYWTFHKGETTGSSSVTTAVQSKTIQTLDAARISKERTDAETHAQPYEDRVNSTR